MSQDLARSLIGRARFSCGRKVRYGSEATANKAIADLRAKGKAATGRRGILEAYSCLYCSKWHIGHTGGSR